MGLQSRWVKWAALGMVLAASLVQEMAPLVKTTSGLVRGRLSTDRLQYIYYGLPYGTVTTENRFQAPLPPPKWEGIYDAIEENIRCPQRMVGSQVFGDPDCLKLNIYAPVRRNKLLPVMVYIHGGCFFEGTGSNFLYGGDYFADHGVILVGLNYRLNVEGFLCLGIKEAPGNAGLKDQIAALKWIRKNIKAFGGDPDNVTLFGESAGAVSTSMLIASESARGLFHKAILQSGSSLAPWGLQHDPINTARTLVKAFGHNTKDPHKMYRILSNKSVEELINAIKYAPHRTYITSETLFVPCVEKDIPGIEPVFTKHPKDIIMSGNYTKLPMIIGYNNNEGIYFVAQDFGRAVNEVDSKETLQPDLEFPSEREVNDTAQMIKSTYFDDKDMTEGMIELYSDLHFKIPALLESELYAQTTDQPIYYYLFKYSGSINMPKIISQYWHWGGASHADELFYMFKPHSFPLPHSFLEEEMIRRMTTLWTNFAKYSNPTPGRLDTVSVRWEAGSKHDPMALVIDQQVSKARASQWYPRPEALKLWNQTYAQYRRKHYGFQKFGVKSSLVVSIK